MNEKSRPQNQKTNLGTQLTRVTKLLRRAQDSLNNSLGAPPTYRDLQEWTGVAEGTIKYWFSNCGEPTAEFVLQMVERIPERHRDPILAPAYRVYPSLEHPRLECDQTCISWLRTIICEPRGLVFIQGGSDENRTFVLTALGNAFLSLTKRPHRLAGLDAHQPDWFVPLPGVRYLGNLFHPLKLQQAVKDNWPKLHEGGTQLIVLNMIGVLASDLQTQIKPFTALCPVLVAEAAQVKASVLKRAAKGPIHVVAVANHPENAKRIALTIEAV